MRWPIFMDLELEVPRIGVQWPNDLGEIKLNKSLLRETTGEVRTNKSSITPNQNCSIIYDNQYYRLYFNYSLDINHLSVTEWLYRLTT